jgi:hypothetical protein
MAGIIVIVGAIRHYLVLSAYVTQKKMRVGVLGNRMHGRSLSV